jgi:hypothetical protein
MIKLAKKAAGWAMICLPALCLAQVASAQVPTGYFEGKFVNAKGERRDAAVWIRKSRLLNGMSETFALVYHQGGKAQLFRVDEVSEDTHSWMQMFQSADGRLVFGDDATYSGMTFVNDGHARLVLSIADYGAQIGCDERIEVESKSSDYDWEDLPTAAHKVDGGGSAGGLIDSRKFNGHFTLDGKMYDGTYELEPIFAGAALLHREATTDKSVDGHKIDKEISAVVVAIRHRRTARSDYDAFELISIQPGSETCLSSRTRMDD